MLFVVDPETFGGQPFTGTDRRNRPNDSNKLTPAFGLYFQHREAAFFTEKSDSFDQAGNCFDSSGAGRFDRRELRQKVSEVNRCVEHRLKFQSVARNVFG